MDAKERGNAILISVILVFGLTVTALGVSRLLVKSTESMSVQKGLLGSQASALCEAAIEEWLSEPHHVPPDDGAGSFATPAMMSFPPSRLLPGPDWGNRATVSLSVIPQTPIDCPDANTDGCSLSRKSSVYQLTARALVVGTYGRAQRTKTVRVTPTFGIDASWSVRVLAQDGAP